MIFDKLRESRRQRRTIHSCGNCRERFKSDAELREHHERGCPQVLMEREIAECNAAAWRASRRREAEAAGDDPRPFSDDPEEYLDWLAETGQDVDQFDEADAAQEGE